MNCKRYYVGIETTCRMHDLILYKLQRAAGVVSTAAMGHSFSWFLVGQKMRIRFSLIRLYFRSRFITQNYEDQSALFRETTAVYREVTDQHFG